MKHVKAYDNYSYDNVKKYFIFNISILPWYAGEGINLLEVADIQKQHGVIVTRELYTCKDGNIKDAEKRIFGVLDKNFDNILYTSDSMEDCLERLPILENEIKYNL